MSTKLPFRLAWILAAATLATVPQAHAQPSVARAWNEVLLEAIRDDFARPTVHARNLFHVSASMYDAWAAYDGIARPWLLGSRIGVSTCSFEGIGAPGDRLRARREAISHAAYGIIRHRFAESPGADSIMARSDALMTLLGFDAGNRSLDYHSGSAAALGNHIADCYIRFGLADGANEADQYANRFYDPINPPLVIASPGNDSLLYPDRWQPLTLDQFIDQSGNVLLDNTPSFIGAEWGWVQPFSLTEADATTLLRDGQTYRVYHDPGPPPSFRDDPSQDSVNDYQWGFALVAAWSAHLDPANPVEWDISPSSLGDIPYFPRTLVEYPNFYDFTRGGSSALGRPLNPRTGEAYAPNRVRLGDYARVLAEFWADGPDSETPPGHWFVILNGVNDHPALRRQLMGQGAELSPLEWDVKAYFALGGAMHDSAIAAWSIKGFYDYVRPVSALRGMAARGHTDAALPGYDPTGIPLIPGLLELIEPGDPLAGSGGEHVGKVKVFGWRGPFYVRNPRRDVAGVGWIRLEDWWPYQRPSFVTPPFAGYVSGHSTFSRAAAEVLTALTGDEYFPGGLAEFAAPAGEFLVFEYGPSEDVVLQWATYRDASDQTSLSRIWGGIHPPADDLPGRIIGERVGTRAFAHAQSFFDGSSTVRSDQVPESEPSIAAYPNPAPRGSVIRWDLDASAEVFDALGRKVRSSGRGSLDTSAMRPGLYLLRLPGETLRVLVGGP